MTKHVVCYSGGHSSALVAIEVSRRFGTKDLLLVNHDIHPSVEHEDIKRFKREVAAHLGVPITFVNMPGVETMDQFDVVMKAKAFKVGTGTALCTHRLKTEPFHGFLQDRFPGGGGCVIYYGFDAAEKARIQRRAQILAAMGYRSDYPLAFWPRTIRSTTEIGIQPPLTYSQFKHANCVGCLKAGRQHWYVVYCTRPDVWEKAKKAEAFIGYSILKDVDLDELEPLFAAMRAAGVEATEKIPPGTFWARVRKMNLQVQEDATDERPCECVI